MVYSQRQGSWRWIGTARRCAESDSLLGPSDSEKGWRMPGRPEGDQEVPNVHPGVEEARRVAIDRLEELGRWVAKAKDHARRSSLYELETDFQVMEQMAGISAQQVLRVLRESGLLRDAAHLPEHQRPDEVGQRRERDREE